MLDRIDKLLNGVTMYRLVLYFLIVLLIAAVLFGQLNILPYSPISIIFSTAVILIVSILTNKICVSVFKSQPNTESTYITALILSLIITPALPSQISAMPLLIWAAILAITSKYIIAIKNKHVFNPVAFAVATTALTIGGAASWWVGGNLPMMAFVVLGGLLIVRKVNKSSMVISFLSVAILTVALTYSGDIASNVSQLLLHTPLFFFAFVMLTEPLTTPPTRSLEIIYGAMVGFLFSPAIHIGTLYSTPELALVVGNIFSYIVSPKEKLILKLKDRKRIGTGIYEFTFKPAKKLRFKPGQYMEWTLAHGRSDDRGSRRYFTLASSPTESALRLGVKFYDYPSSFKNNLLSLVPGEEIMAGQLAGDFTMPKNKKIGLVFIAGGIGITPFRSMIKYLSDSGDKRSVTLLYANHTASEVVYSDVFREAEDKIGLRTIYTLTDKTSIPAGWEGSTGRIDTEMIKHHVPDYQHKTFYISGTYKMVADTKATLQTMKIPTRQIKTDFFPGFS